MNYHEEVYVSHNPESCLKEAQFYFRQAEIYEQPYGEQYMNESWYWLFLREESLQDQGE